MTAGIEGKRTAQGPEILDYQKPFVDRVTRVIRDNFLSIPPSLRILDAGCDPSGRQLWHLARLTKGEVIGINIGEDFPSSEAQALLPSNARLMNMDAMAQEFPDESFDMVVSANVLEHVSDPARYLAECSRVLRRKGIGCFETYPVWSGPRGHHAMESMVQRFCAVPEADRFRNDGTIIPDWGHLVYDRQRMHDAIGDKVPPEVRDYLLYVIYDAPDINRVPWREILAAFREHFADVSIAPSTEAGANPGLRPAVPPDDYGVAGFSAVVRKARSSTVNNFWRRRILWRLRRILET
jgi:SAM-dependent methyltransferase